MYKIILLCLLLCALLTTPVFARSTVMESPCYKNSRYGISICWPSGSYTLEEADNADITVMDGQGLRMSVYGTYSYSVLGQSFADAVADQKTSFDFVTYKHIREKEGWFVLSGYRVENIGYLKCIFSSKAAYFVDITYPKKENHVMMS